MAKIKNIIVILETRGGYYGFQLTRCSDGLTIEGQGQCENNIRIAFTNDGNDWLRDYYLIKVPSTEKYVFSLPQAGCLPADLRQWAAKQFRNLKKKQKQDASRTHL